MIFKAFQFIGAILKEARHGSNPNRASEDVIKHRLSICETCEHFTGNKCNKCGCCAGAQKSWFNKLAYKTQECPIGLWTIDRSDESPSNENSDE